MQYCCYYMLPSSTITTILRSATLGFYFSIQIHCDPAQISHWHRQAADEQVRLAQFVRQPRQRRDLSPAPKHFTSVYSAEGRRHIDTLEVDCSP